MKKIMFMLFAVVAIATMFSSCTTADILNNQDSSQIANESEARMGIFLDSFCDVIEKAEKLDVGVYELTLEESGSKIKVEAALPIYAGRVVELSPANTLRFVYSKDDSDELNKFRQRKNKAPSGKTATKKATFFMSIKVADHINKKNKTMHIFDSFTTGRTLSDKNFQSSTLVSGDVCSVDFDYGTVVNVSKISK